MRTNTFKYILIVIFSVILVLVLIFFHLRGVTYFDEGYIINAALRTLHGEIPYRDFDMVYTPLSFVVSSWFLFIFGESVFSERLAALAVSVLSLMALYFLLKQLTKNIYIIIISLLFFVAWGPAHINFAWPVMFASCFLLYALLFFHLGVSQNSKKYVFLSGIMTILVFLSKQNFGIGIFFVFLVAFIFVSQTKRKVLLTLYLLGFASASGIYLIILIFTSSFIPFIENMYLYTFKRVILDKSLNTPFLYEGTLLARFTKLLFYISPFIISSAAFLVNFNKNKKLLFIPLSVAFFYLLGVRPTTDYVHISPLIALAILPLVLIITYARNNALKYSSIIIMVFLTLLGFYTAYFKGYYQWEASMKAYNSYSSNQRLRIYLTDEQIKDANDLQKYVDLRTTKDDYIFVNYYAPLVYFLTDRNNPTPYDLISTNQLPTSYQMNIIKKLKQKKVKLVMLHDLNKDENSIISNYIRKAYPHKRKV